MKSGFSTCALLLLLWVSASAFAAQNAPFGKSNEPLEITADGSLEWDRANQIFTARKNALAVQGTSSVSGETLIAKYRDSADSDLDIYMLEADRGVKVKNDTSTAYGDHATYDLDKGLAVLTGKDLKLVSPGQTITAKERFEYWVADGRAIAIGRPRVTKPKPQGGVDTLDADEITATFRQNAAGEQALDTMEAKDNVVITTPTEVITGDYGIYHANTNQAELTGAVTIRRGPNILEGNKAIVDMTTNTSTIYGGPENAAQPGSGRVKGVFYPGSTKDEANTSETPPAAQPVQQKPGVEVVPLPADDAPEQNTGGLLTAP